MKLVLDSCESLLLLSFVLSQACFDTHFHFGLCT